MPRTAADRDTPLITPLFPLILLETLRDADRPDEVLEGENLAVSLPRRLGLSDVVFVQIHRFNEEVRKGRPQTGAVVEDLVKLVNRRQDSARIFREAGRRLARRKWGERSAVARGFVRVMPPLLSLRAAARAARRTFRAVVGPGRLTIERRPPGVRIDGCLTARADPAGNACAFYEGLLAELMLQYTGRDHGVEHAACEGRGAAACEWRALVTG